jgi:hypothetical protein
MVDKKEKCEDIEKLKAEYDRLKQKYKLPAFDELDADFEIRDIDYGCFVIKEIRRIIVRKMEGILGLLDPILNPSQGSLHSMIETKIFEKQDLEPMFDYYKKLCQMAHNGITTSLESEAAEAAWINEVAKAWPGIKKEAAGYSKKIADGWGKVESEIFTDRYLG